MVALTPQNPAAPRQNAPISVVFYAPSYDSLGGGEIWLNRVANEMRRRAHAVTVIGKRPPVDRVLGMWEPGINRVYLSTDGPSSVPTRERPRVRDLRLGIARFVAGDMGRRLDGLIRGWRPPGMFQRDIDAAARSRLIAAIRDAQARADQERTVVVCSDVYTASHLSDAVERGLLQIPYIIIHHLSFASMSWGTRRALHRAAQRAAILVALTDEDAEGFRGAGFERVSSIPNPSPPAPRTSSRPESLVVWLGRMTAQKSVHIAVEAWSRVCGAHPGWRLALYGDGAERARVAARIAELGVGDSVELAGVTGDPEAVFARAAVNLLPSQFEGWGLVIGEAGMHAVPTVAFDSAPGVRAQIEHRVDGMLVPLNDIDQLSADLDELLSDATLRRALGAGARARALGFSIERVGDRWDTLLVEAAGNSPRG